MFYEIYTLHRPSDLKSSEDDIWTSFKINNLYRIIINIMYLYNHERAFTFCHLFQFTKYRITDPSTEEYLKFRLCDMRGLVETMDIKSEDIVHLLDGHLPNKYKVVMYSIYIRLLTNPFNKTLCFWSFFTGHVKKVKENPSSYFCVSIKLN